MEEDIKILEEKIKIIESLCTDDCINKSTVIDPLKYALENLLTRYKQLEEENKRNLQTLFNYEGIKNKINDEWRLKIKEKLWKLDKNEHERINKIKNPNEMFPNLIYISNKKILEQLLKEGEI